MTAESLTAIALICVKAASTQSCLHQIDRCFHERTAPPACSPKPSESFCGSVGPSFVEADVLYQCMLKLELHEEKNCKKADLR